MLALNGPAGDEAAFNRWYEEEHLADFKKIDAVKSARRYKVFRGNLPGMEAWPYVTAYEIETDDIAAVSKRFATEVRPAAAVMDRSRSAYLWAEQVGGDD
jgi:hypothetical protein